MIALRTAPTMYGLFAHVADRHTDRAAVVTPTGVSTYAELDAAVTRQAGGLAERGVGPGDVVAIFMGRGMELITAVLAASACGAAWLTIDPANPRRRVQSIVEQAAPSLVLVDDTTAGVLAGFETTTSLELSTSPISGLVREAPADDVAYLVFTSGSTGVPKGVRVPQAGLENLSAGIQQHLDIGPDDRLLQFSSTGFDAFVFEILMALTTGASLWLGPPESLIVGEPLENTIREHGITAVVLSPTAHGAINPSRVPALRILVSGAEQLTPAAVARWSAPGRKIINAYGPSEATVAVSMGVVSEGGRIDVGLPLPGFTVAIADGDGCLHNEPGRVGELVAIGDGVALGYLPGAGERIDAFRLIASTDRAEPVRAYHTGDLADLASDGRIMIRGRIGDQVKVRGHRVELGEVDAAAELSSDVVMCRTRAMPGPEGGLVLHSFIVAVDGTADAGLVIRLRKHLADYLLAAMIPSVITVVPAIPLTVNGKTDWQALGSRQGVVGEPGTVRQGTLERVLSVLAVVLSEHELGEGRLGSTDDFFMSGGHSLLVPMVADRLQEQFGRKVPLRVIVRYRSAAGIAEWLDNSEPGLLDTPASR
ncbi:hypothetical protein Q0Z83_053980 [Actinoplanes sichuanensis]|uniref:AMP-binding protein n=1 Tax=Actinoplanes sichuanensis TaxID=512349 RepID=A0ABW4ATY8_9ACTN|nr:non-ribosomal peptide synthetase [Actinoplanes sichuanensis]BEL07207.1 hypothetical protein Q0Z83_053980 [Actinoplanes sichuanensis]